MSSIAAHPAQVFVAAANEHDADDLLVGLKDFSVSDSCTTLDISEMNGSVDYKVRMGGLTDASISLSCDYEQDDVPQGLLRAVAGTLVYVSMVPGGNGTAGYTYPMLAESYEIKGEVDGLVSVSVSLVGNGARTVF